MRKREIILPVLFIFCITQISAESRYDMNISIDETLSDTVCATTLFPMDSLIEAENALTGESAELTVVNLFRNTPSDTVSVSADTAYSLNLNDGDRITVSILNLGTYTPQLENRTELPLLRHRALLETKDLLTPPVSGLDERISVPASDSENRIIVNLRGSRELNLPFPSRLTDDPELAGAADSGTSANVDTEPAVEDPDWERIDTILNPDSGDNGSLSSADPEIRVDADPEIRVDYEIMEPPPAIETDLPSDSPGSGDSPVGGSDHSDPLSPGGYRLDEDEERYPPGTATGASGTDSSAAPPGRYIQIGAYAEINSVLFAERILDGTAIYRETFTDASGQELIRCLVPLDGEIAVHIDILKNLGFPDAFYRLVE